jgi:RNA-splicing ligase RtcB
MIEIQGTYNIAKVFTNNIEKTAIDQIEELCNQEFSRDLHIRIMPDVHAGSGCVIGYTANLKDKVIPNLIGVDIGCGMVVGELGNIDIDLSLFDNVIRKHIPSGFSVHSEKIAYNYDFDYQISKLLCLSQLKDNDNKFRRSIGTLGSGNHFIELNVDNENNKYLVIHSGSRNLGLQVANYYQKLAIKNLSNTGIPKDLCYLEDYDLECYIHDMNICQNYAKINRDAMMYIIVEKYGFSVDSWHTIHNYIDFGDKVVRKGAVSAHNGEKLIIPMNMRDGSLLCTGKGNNDWNNSAPHGAGRIMGRKEAKRVLNMEDFSETMKDIYSTTINDSTLDEAPMAYKPMQEIVDNIKDTVTVDKIIKPVYNYKSSD